MAADPHYATGAWQLRDIKTEWVPASESEVDDGCDEVTLVKPAGDTGTSLENTNLALPVDVGDILKVEYDMSDTANAGAGAVRMFVYDTANADTNIDGPSFAGVTGNGPDTSVSWFIVPDTSTTGTATLTFTQAGTIGSFGLTYDASNATAGSVTFSNLRIGALGEDDTPISFCAKPRPPAGGGSLANTGTSLTTVIAVAAALIVVGIGAVLVARRRRASS
jgi:LPXTG-motif cell wall-anchored protein